MRSPTTAILWEIWARNRGALIFAWGLLVFYAVLTMPMLRLDGRSASEPMWLGIAGFFGALLSITCLFWAFTFTSIDERGRFAGFPSRLFTLPVKTWHAAALPIGAGLAAILTAYLAWGSMLFYLMGPATGRIPWVAAAWQLLILGTAFVSMQLLVWLLYPFRHLRVVVLAGVAVGFFGLWVWLEGESFFRRPGVCFAALAAAFVASVAAAFKVVAWDREGGWQSVRAHRVPALRRGLAGFSSSDKAQLWFEWRRKGWFAAVILGTCVGLSLWLWAVPSSLSNEISLPEAVHTSMFWFSAIIAVFLASALGSGLGKPDFWTPEIALPGFLATRPLTSAEFVIAKLRVAARVVAFGACFLLTVLLAGVLGGAKSEQQGYFWASFLSEHPLLWRWLSHPGVALTFAAVLWHTMVQSMSVALSGDRRAVVWSGWQSAATFFLVGGCVIWFTRYPQHWDAFLRVLPPIALSLMAWKVWRTVILFRRAHHLLSRRQRCVLIGIWCGLAAGIVFSAWFATRLGGMDAPLIWLLAAWVMPAGELPASVLNLARNRHQ